MTEPSRQPETSTGNRPVSSAGTPRWVKVFGLIAAVLIAVFVVLHLTGHGLGGHMG